MFCINSLRKKKEKFKFYNWNEILDPIVNFGGEVRWNWKYFYLFWIEQDDFSCFRSISLKIGIIKIYIFWTKRLYLKKKNLKIQTIWFNFFFFMSTIYSLWRMIGILTNRSVKEGFFFFFWKIKYSCKYEILLPLKSNKLEPSTLFHILSFWPSIKKIKISNCFYWINPFYLFSL